MQQIRLLYADDTALIFESKSGPELQENISQELQNISRWLQANKLTLNINKTVYQTYPNLHAFESRY